MVAFFFLLLLSARNVSRTPSFFILPRFWEKYRRSRRRGHNFLHLLTHPFLPHFYERKSPFEEFAFINPRNPKKSMRTVEKTKIAQLKVHDACAPCELNKTERKIEIGSARNSKNAPSRLQSGIYQKFCNFLS